MSFDPAKPAANSPLNSAEMRDQLNGLKEIIDTTPPGPEGPRGRPRGVTAQQFSDAMAQALSNAAVSSSANTNGVAALETQISDPPTQGDVQAVMDQLNELIAALRRQAMPPLADSQWRGAVALPPEGAHEASR